LNDFSKVLRKKHAIDSFLTARMSFVLCETLLSKINSLQLHFPPGLVPGVLASLSGAVSGTALRLKLSTSVGNDSSLGGPHWKHRSTAGFSRFAVD
jgi:hypothetical protein